MKGCFKTIVKFVGWGFVLLIVIGVIGNLVSPSEKQANQQIAAASNVSSDVVTIEPTNTLSPTNTPVPTDTPAPRTLQQVLAAALGDSNRAVERIKSVDESMGVLNVDWSINDNLTENMVRTGARMDAAKLLVALHDTGVQFDMVNLTGYLSLIDGFGNTSEDPVVWVTFNRGTFDRINWEDRQYVDFVLYQYIYEIADTAKLHSLMQD